MREALAIGALLLTTCPTATDREADIRSHRHDLSTALVNSQGAEAESEIEPEGGESDDAEVQTEPETVCGLFPRGGFNVISGVGCLTEKPIQEPVAAPPSAVSVCAVVGGSIPGLNEACGGAPLLPRPLWIDGIPTPADPENSAPAEVR